MLGERRSHFRIRRARRGAARCGPNKGRNRTRRAGLVCLTRYTVGSSKTRSSKSMKSPLIYLAITLGAAGCASLVGADFGDFTLQDPRGSNADGGPPAER